MEFFYVEICVNQIPVYVSEPYFNAESAISEIRYNTDEIVKRVESDLYGQYRDEEKEGTITELFDRWFKEFESTGYKPEILEPDDEDDVDDIHFALYRKVVLDKFVPPHSSSVKEKTP